MASTTKTRHGKSPYRPNISARSFTLSFFSGIPNYFRNSDITPAEASGRGLLARDKGRKGFAIGQNASDDLYALYRSGKIAESKAAAIADTAKGERLGALIARSPSPSN